MQATASEFWSVSAPTAGTVLATWSPGYLATYELDIYAYLTGSPAPGNADNIGVYVNSVLSCQLPVPSEINQSPTKITVFVIADVTDAIDIRAVANAGMGSVYHGLMVGRLAQF